MSFIPSVTHHTHSPTSKSSVYLFLLWVNQFNFKIVSDKSEATYKVSKKRSKLNPYQPLWKLYVTIPETILYNKYI